MQHPETRTVPEARACVWGDNTPELLERLQKHVAKEKTDHVWMGFFLVDNNDSMLSEARKMALKSAL